MKRDFDSLSSHTFDVALIGGGITGACVAHDATLRGLSVCLIEKGDFGGATSAASSKLLHGGIRYLQQLQFHRVRESARERAAFRRVAPHLLRWVPFLIPTTRSVSKGRVVLTAGVAAYRVLLAGIAGRAGAAGLAEPSGGFFSKGELIDRFPWLASLRDLTGAWVIHETHMQSSERMTLAFVKTAASRGAAVANYVEVVGFRREGSHVAAVEVRDRLTGRRCDVGARLVVNAAGPWIGVLNESLGDVHLRRDITALAKGMHIVTRPLTGDAAIALATRHQSQAVIQRGGRHIFVIPWRGCSLIGTTNVPFSGLPDHVGVEPGEVAAFVDDINAALPAAQLSLADVRHAFAGLYPLTETTIRADTYQGTGAYQLVDHADSGGPSNYMSALGAKYTTARGFASRVVDRVFQKLRIPNPGCSTATTPLACSRYEDVDAYRRQAVARHRGTVDTTTIDHLVILYGSDTDAVLTAGHRTPTGFSRLGPDQPDIEAQVRYAVADEMALTLEDVVFRRTGLGTAGRPQTTSIARVASIMAEALAWDEPRTREELARLDTRFQIF